MERVFLLRQIQNVPPDAVSTPSVGKILDKDHCDDTLLHEVRGLREDLQNFTSYRNSGENEVTKWDKISREQHKGAGWTNIAKLELGVNTSKKLIERKADQIKKAVTRFRYKE